ncbi:MAG: C/D box methylation guide ribonucleoprotein complex aNOP56 subunit [Candidatus Aenigmarchaeota archaeon]|nr:C/D box methylation guide ribonucleoprotein complex aNOP56 subunit [Candidatus Aenigmarchaeota archaeon]
MQAYLVKTFIGIFALDENRKVVSFRPFPKDGSDVASRLDEKEPKEYKEIKIELKQKGFKTFVDDDEKSKELVNQNLRKYAIEYKFSKDVLEFNQFLSKVNQEVSKRKIKSQVSRDSLVINTNNAIDELDKSINIFVERMREFYGLHFPEMDRLVSDHEKYAEIIKKYGTREKISDSELKKFAEDSMGIEFTGEDVGIASILADNVIELYNLRKKLSDYLGNLLKEVAPNFSALGGDLIAAKLISRAGGMDRLSKMPSSTIQLLGSEKALFRFLRSKGRSKSPKYGLIYNHPLIQNSPADKQGKIARLLASKLSIAARIDYYSGEYRGDEMKKELHEKVKEILKEK